MVSTSCNISHLSRGRIIFGGNLIDGTCLQWIGKDKSSFLGKYFEFKFNALEIERLMCYQIEMLI